MQKLVLSCFSLSHQLGRGSLFPAGIVADDSNQLRLGRRFEFLLPRASFLPVVVEVRGFCITHKKNLRRRRLKFNLDEFTVGRLFFDQPTQFKPILDRRVEVSVGWQHSADLTDPTCSGLAAEQVLPGERHQVEIAAT